ncbi:fumarylacetoacetase [Agrobacterium sp. 13-626]|nr:fumarylacetoacetase [Agrobacterium sp. 13-626]
MAFTDKTHDPLLASWVESADTDTDFPIQNLPLGVFSPADEDPRGGVAIGNMVLDLRALASSGLLSGEALAAATAASGGTLNDFLAMGACPRKALRVRLSELLARNSAYQKQLIRFLHSQSEVRLQLPVRIGDYTDFYVGIHHATQVGKLFRPDNPLLPNYKYVPIGYHGRASSVIPSGIPVRRPVGQTKPANMEVPTYGPSQRLDYELELGVWVGPGNEMGTPIGIAEAADHIAGFSLLNDWSARDIQAWEYQPLGPFLAKNFASTVSPWIISPEALSPFRVAQPARPEGDPVPMDYLFDATDQREGAFALELEVLLLTPGMKSHGLPAHRLALSNTTHMYWTVAQLLTHHTSNGCNLRPGDFLGSGTISGPDTDSTGSLLEATQSGKSPVELASGEKRQFLEDGDEVILRARGRREGFVSIGFGECRAEVIPARS